MCEQDGICGAGPTGALSEPMRRLFGTSPPSLPIGASADQQGRFLQPFRVLGGGLGMSRRNAPHPNPGVPDERVDVSSRGDGALGTCEMLLRCSVPIKGRTPSGTDAAKLCSRRLASSWLAGRMRRNTVSCCSVLFDCRGTGLVHAQPKSTSTVRQGVDEDMEETPDLQLSRLCMEGWRPTASRPRAVRRPVCSRFTRRSRPVGGKVLCTKCKVVASTLNALPQQNKSSSLWQRQRQRRQQSEWRCAEARKPWFANVKAHA